MGDSKSLDVNGNSKMTCEGEDEDWEDEDDWTDGDEDDGANKANERLVHVRFNRELYLTKFFLRLNLLLQMTPSSFSSSSQQILRLVWFECADFM